MSPLVLQSLLFVGNDRRRTDRSRTRRRFQAGLEFLEDRITPTSVTGLSPSAGPLLGGTMVTITGTGFTGATAVDFGPNLATDLNPVNATTITADSPAGTGTVDVTVTAPGGTSPTSPADQFAYVATPTVSAVSPNDGPAAGGTMVTITGTGFTRATTVDFGTNQATNLTVASDTTITAYSPAGTGAVGVTVTTPGGTSATSTADQFTYAPSISSISPTAGTVSGGTVVTIMGTGFAGATAVDFGATPATTFTVVGASTITALSPAGTGAVGVTVTTPSGTSATSPANVFTYYAAPTVTGISPTAGPLGGGTLVTITGTGFTGATAVDFGTNPATNLMKLLSNTTITVDSPAGTGTVDVSVTSPGGTSATSPADQFTYQAAPTVTGVGPTFGPAGGGTLVTITGSGFTGATAVDFGTNPATDLTSVSATSITAESPAGTGTVDVTVTTPGGISATSPADQFTYSPTVSSISPAAGPLGGGTLVTITGTGFTGASAVDFGTTPATTFTVGGASMITALSPAGTGAVGVTVTTPSGTSATSTADVFTYVASPTVTGISPTAGPLGGGTVVTITGTGFTETSATGTVLPIVTAVDFGTTPATIFTVINNTTLMVGSPAGTGTVDVTVTTPGGSSAKSPADQFTYVATPTVAAVSPNDGPAAGGTMVTITGTGFTNATAVAFGTNPAPKFKVVSDTLISVDSPAGTGTVDVIVTSPGGPSVTSPADVFVYTSNAVIAPRVLAISPNFGPPTGGTLVTITGTGFSPGAPTSVYFGAAAATSVTVVSPTTMTAKSPAVPARWTSR